MFDAKGDGEVLTSLKKEFSRRSDSFTEDDLTKFWNIAISSTLSFGTRTLAAQLYTRAGGKLVADARLDKALLCGLILECKPAELSELFEWISNVEDLNDVRILRSVLSSLQRNSRKKLAFISSNTALAVLRKVFRGLLVTCTSADDVRQLGTVLNLQRLYGVTASQQFKFISRLPNSLKQKFSLLTFVIPALNASELCEAEHVLSEDLWDCLNIQFLASSTGDCALAWALASVKLNTQYFPFFLASALSSSNSVRRSSCAGFWLARLGNYPGLRPLLKLVARLLEKNIEQTPPWPLSVDEIRQLSCVDYDWHWKEDEEVWTSADCVLYGWIAIQEVLVKNKSIDWDDSEHWLFGVCFRGCQPSIRLRAFRIATLLLKNPSQVDAQFAVDDLKKFILDNIGTDDPSLREAILEYGRENPQILEQDFCEKLILRIHFGWNSQTITTSLRMLHGTLFDMALLQRLCELAADDSSQIRSAAYGLLPAVLDEALVNFFKNELQQSLNLISEDMDRIEDLVRVLLLYHCDDWLFTLVRQNLDGSSPGTLKCLQVLIEKRQEKFMNAEIQTLFEKCWKLIDDYLKKTGSEEAGQCASLVDLKHRLYPDPEPSPAMLSENCRLALNTYYWTLRCSAELLVTLCKGVVMSTSEVSKTFDCLWNVLMRSYHKGVVDHVADCFEKLARQCCKREFTSSLLIEYYEKTKRLFANELTTTRNLSFSRVLRFLAIHANQIGSLVEFLLSCGGDTQLSKVAVRAWKTLKFILNSAEIDISQHFLAIYTTLLDVYGHSIWAIRSAALHCYAVLVSRTSRIGEGSNYPLFNFILLNNEIWKELLARFCNSSVNERGLLLLLSLIETFHLIDSSFYDSNQISEVKQLVTHCAKLLCESRDIRLGRILGRCLTQLTPECSRLRAKLQAFLYRDLPSNLRCSLEYISDKLASESEALEPLHFDGEYRNIMETGNGYFVKQAAELVQESSSHQNEDGSFPPEQNMDTVFSEAEECSLSTRELRRLRAAHMVIVLKRVLNRQGCERRKRYFCYTTNLLMDEVVSVRNIASRVATSSSSPKPLYSVSPTQAIKLLAKSLVENGEISLNDLLEEWGKWSEETRSRRQKFNRYFEDALVHEVLKACLPCKPDLFGGSAELEHSHRSLSRDLVSDGAV